MYNTTLSYLRTGSIIGDNHELEVHNEYAVGDLLVEHKGSINLFCAPSSNRSNQ